MEQKQVTNSVFKHKGFLALTNTQFWGALNDNAFKMLVTFIALQMISPEVVSRYVQIASLVFVIPFILFSTYAGYASDKFSKKKIAVWTKIFEIAVMLIGFVALYATQFDPKYLNTLIFIVFLMGLQSTFFSPAKYGLLPEMLQEKDLSISNGIISLSTFVAIILGNQLAGWLSGSIQEHIFLVGSILLGIACIGTVSSFFIDSVPPSGSQEKFEWNFVSKFIRNMKEIMKDRTLYLCVIGTGFFWFIGALLLIIFPLYGKGMMGLEDKEISNLITILNIGIGVGCAIAGKLSGGKIELGLVPLGSIGMGIFSIDLALSYETMNRVAVDLFFLGFFSGFFAIPLTALLQQRSPKEAKGKTIATSNIVTFIFIAFSSGVSWILMDKVALNLDPAQSFIAVGIITLVATLYILYLLPVTFTRFILWVLTHTIYRIKVLGRKHFPETGPVLMVCNHMSYVDPFLITATVSRPIRFFMYRKLYEWRGLNWFFKLMGVIPISPADGPKKFMASMQTAREALKNGEIVCIFAEGAITRVAQTLGFHKGVEIIAKGSTAPILPVHLDRVWGSIFSFHKSEFIWKIPRHIPYPVTVSFGKPLPSTSKVHRVRQAVLDLGSRAFAVRDEVKKSLHGTLLRHSKLLWLSKSMVDSSGMKLSFGKVVTASVSLARKFRALIPNSKNVGVLFPPCVPGALTNIALPMAGKIPVNLNFTMTKDLIEKIITKAGIEKVITSRKVIQALKWEEDSRMIFLEDLPKPSNLISLFWWAFLWITPSFLIESWILPGSKVNHDDLLTLVFTSGSTGTPKGVMLTHRNILSNVSGLLEVFQLDNKDRILGVLPFFHSFGFTATLWLPLMGGFPAIYHRSPLEASQISKLIREHRGTVLLGTPTFLQMWMKKFKPEDIQSLRFAMVGAEKLRDSIAKEFLEKFKVQVLEGYGSTELSPVACTSVLNVKDRHEFQLGHKEGKVGRPLPGVSVKIVDPDTRKVVEPGTPGLLLVRGPNVMKGYFEDEKKTLEVMLKRWYITGDIAKIDEEGFIQITDRLTRFSKIGGEMVPHILVEERLYEVAQEPEAQFIVTAVPDPGKGESLVVLYHNLSANIDSIMEKLKQTDLPKLWIPSQKLFFKLDEWPTLGTGKVDIAKAKNLALKLTSK